MEFIAILESILNVLAWILTGTAIFGAIALYIGYSLIATLVFVAVLIIDETSEKKKLVW